MTTEERKNKKRAWEYFESIGKIPKDKKPYEYVMHHKDTTLKERDPERYKGWFIEDLEVVTKQEHNAIHFTGIKITRSEEYRKKQSIAQTGKHHSEEARLKMSIARKGVPKSSEHRRKIGESNIGKHSNPLSEEWKDKIGETMSTLQWFNNGVVNKRTTECPDGFVPGRLYFKRRRRIGKSE